MCGIAGIWQPDGRASKSELVRMLGAMRHRGPEGTGVATVDAGRLALGFLKLAFTDLPGGMQPMFTEGGAYGIVFNGEVYDHVRLRRELEAKGHRFTTKSDTEVVLRSWAEHGPACLARFDGEFAFVLWDAHRRELIAVRDRFGVKPLYVARHRGAFCFASENKAILALDGFPRALHPEWLVGPGLGFADTGAAPFAGISQVRPGHLLRVSEHGEALERWWRPPFGETGPVTFAEARLQVREVVTRSVERRVGGDVPIALSLSSGMDSAIVAGLTHRLRPDRVAFCTSFPGEPWDESAGAAATAKALGLAFEPVACPISALAEGFLPSIRATEIATNSLSTVARLRVSAAVRAAGFKALAGGEAADEVFGGYPYFGLEAIRRAGDGQALARFRREEAASRGVFWDDGALPPELGAYALRVNRTLRLARFLLARPLPSAETILARELDLAWARALHPFDATRLVSRGILGTFGFPALGDRVEMANSLEGRVPFLGAEVLDLAYRLTPEWCVDPRTFERKVVLRRAFPELAPPQPPPPKHTFLAPPFRHLLTTPAGRELVETFLSARVGVFAPRAVGALRLAWQVCPASSARFSQLDALVGYVLSVHALHHVFVERPMEVTPILDVEERTPVTASSTVPPARRGAR